MTGGSHGSIERAPGALFRAMGALFLQKKKCSGGALARELKEHLATLGVGYHVRTLRRQLTGRVASVPPEVQGAMRHVLLRANGLRTDLDIERALDGTGLSVPSQGRELEYVSTTRIVPLAQLWLLFNAGRSRRFLASVLSDRLARRGLRLNVNSLQSILGGTQRLARREALEELLGLLAPHGIAFEGAASELWQRRQTDIASHTEDRALEPSDRLVALAGAWKLRSHQPSSRHLAERLRKRLGRHGLSLCLLHVQRTVDGKMPYVRRALMVEMEMLLGEVLLEGEDVTSEIARAAQNKTRQQDLLWVQAGPIAALAKGWIAQHPGITMRQLSLRVARSVRRMGFQTSGNTIQTILGGHKRRTRGFVYRAMLKQIRGACDRIPEEHFVVSTSVTRVPAPSPVAGKRCRLPAAALKPQRSTLSHPALALTSSDPLDAYQRTVRQFAPPSVEAEVELATKIEGAERQLVGALVRSAAVVRSLADIARRLDNGELSPSDIIIGSVSKDAATERQERARLRDVLAQVVRLEVQCDRRHRELLSSRRPSATQAARLRVELDDLWRQMSLTLADTRFSASHLRHLQSVLGTVVGAAEKRDDEQHGHRRLEERKVLPLKQMKQIQAAVQAASKGLTRARNDLVTANLRLVFFVVKRFRHRGVDPIDLIQEGNIGLLRAAEKFDRKQGCRFATYARWWIRASVEDTLVNQSRTIRLPASVLQLRRRAQELDETGVARSAEDLARSSGMTAETVSRVLSSVVDTVSMHSTTGVGDATLEERLADEASPQPFDGIARREIAEGLGSALLELDAREAMVLRFRYGIGGHSDRSLADIGRELGLSRERIRQIEASALERLRQSVRIRQLSAVLEDISQPCCASGPSGVSRSHLRHP